MAGVTGGVHTAIVLQDGGVLGVHECGVLTAFREQRPGFEPVAVTGISICAVTAAVPGGARTDPVSTLEPSGRSGSPYRLLSGGSSDRSTVRSPSSATAGAYRPSTAPDRAVAGDEHLVDLGELTGDGRGAVDVETELVEYSGRRRDGGSGSAAPAGLVSGRG